MFGLTDETRNAISDKEADGMKELTKPRVDRRNWNLYRDLLALVQQRKTDGDNHA